MSVENDQLRWGKENNFTESVDYVVDFLEKRTSYLSTVWN